ncbi:MAG TPA: 2-C-methyl-D-erythritol 4-phosphate cytidylyltransferase [Phycisphaerae bacterium]|nr:2-C-methyl-D-erythritol 4-phosphate cytidylyltransferase [Phycisphaerae bacterium]HOJ74170.1 2-C-methyl-D-erythritol 4-phosphate cytidylyltransferase [Phycisphaerae bacterium]HOM51248.1 2-C-methyl-D-erythritol 4-phosphate cytidylyltransferase [Phycisphaerae bacterium]HON66443.1 2-C-methyl-D-erythritol 4-phosphate cytidylyltransferase [Phycisphaerae bacterium]HPP26787.1 2-C-methyl-D-erythritol 4-phosphate cytidylyltransferase [Phycisphaerae bacterium]
MPKVAVVIVAAGKGKRFNGGKENKVFAKIDGRPLFLRSVEQFVNRDDVCQTILVISAADEDEVKSKYGANLGFLGVQRAIGGATRADSVAAGLALVREDADLIAIHDAARPCVSTEMIDRVFAEAAKTGAAILAAPLQGTIKRASGANVVDKTIPRENLWEAQTPQVFKASIIREAYNRRTELGQEPTDDAQLVEATGHPVALVRSDFSNLKITVREDLQLATAILKARPKPKPKGPLTPFEEAQW